MRSWVMPTTVFFLGLSLGLSGPMLGSRYLHPHLPTALKDTFHLEGSVTHKERQQDRLRVILTTQDGTLLATFQQQIPEIDLLIEEHDLVTIDVRRYEPFLNDPPVLRVNKHHEKAPAMPPPNNPAIHSEPVPETDPPFNQQDS